MDSIGQNENEASHIHGMIVKWHDVVKLEGIWGREKVSCSLALPQLCRQLFEISDVGASLGLGFLDGGAVLGGGTEDDVIDLPEPRLLTETSEPLPHACRRFPSP